MTVWYQGCYRPGIRSITHAQTDEWRRGGQNRLQRLGQVAVSSLFDQRYLWRGMGYYTRATPLWRTVKARRDVMTGSYDI